LTAPVDGSIDERVGRFAVGSQAVELGSEFAFQIVHENRD
jgi:hypothetical protein